MDIFTQINDISIMEILDKVGIKYKKTLGTLNLYENGKLTDGRKCKIQDGFITDFSGKRSQGDRITFIMNYFNIEKGEAVKWYKDNFNIIDEEKKIKQDLNIKEIFKNYGDLNFEQIKYLESRCISYEKVKDVVKNNNGFACIIYNENGRAITTNTRMLVKKEFRIIAGTESKGVYMGKINKDIKEVYIVEGMFDFLTLYQFGVNVIGLKSVNDGYEVVKSFYKKGYELTYIPDNDEHGKKSLDNLKDIEYYLFDLSKYEVKDINDFLVESGFGEGIFEVINSEKEIQNKKQDVIFTKNKPFTWGTYKLDSLISPIERNHFIIFGGKQGQGKTTFTFDMAQKNAKLGHKILYLSLEMDTENIKTNIARAYAGITKDEWRNKNINEVKIKAYFKKKKEINNIENLKLYGFINGENPTIENIEKVILQERPDLVFIDNFDLIKVNENLQALEKSEKISKFFLNFTNIYLIPCLVLHHIKKGGNGVDGLRGSGKISDDADLILFGSRHQNEEEGYNKMFIIKEEKSRDWGTYETHTTYFLNGSFYDSIDGLDESDFKYLT